MVKVCAVKSCRSGYKSKKKIKEAPYSLSFFQPTTPKRLQRWTQSLGFALKASDYICQFHFKEEDIKMYDKIVIGNAVHLHYALKKTLREEALPTVKHQFQFDPETKEQKSKQSELERKQPKQHQPKQKKTVRKQLEDNIIQHHQQAQETPKIIHPITYLKQKLSVLPQYWFYAEKPNKIEFMRVDPVSKQIKNHIVLNEDFSITVMCSNDEQICLCDQISSPDEIFGYLKFVERWPFCVGTQIEKQRYSKQCKGVIVGDDAYQRNQMNPRCKSCRVLRCRLQSRNRTFNSTLKKSVLCKRPSENIMKHYKPLKKTELRHTILIVKKLGT